MNKQRLLRIKTKMREAGISQLLITDPLSIYYLNGHMEAPGERFYGLYIHENGRHVLFMNRLFPVASEFSDPIVWYSDTDNITTLISNELIASESLGVDKDMTARFLIPLMENKSASAFVLGSDCVDSVRGVKGQDEIEKMARVSALNDQAIGALKEKIKPGVTERQLEQELLEIYQQLGAEGISFEPLVAFGGNAAEPHHFPDDTVLKEGDCVLFDIGCKKDMYCSDMTRTFFFDSVTETHRKVYELVREANETAIAGIKPGLRLCDIDQLARDVITKAGYGEYFTHRLGHFIGLDVHEKGDVSAINETVIEEGMIFSIEPGIYLEGDIGVRIEDLVCVTKDGCQVLNSFPKELQIISGE